MYIIYNVYHITMIFDKIPWKTSAMDVKAAKVSTSEPAWIQKRGKKQHFCWTNPVWFLNISPNWYSFWGDGSRVDLPHSSRFRACLGYCGWFMTLGWVYHIIISVYKHVPQT